MTIQRAREIMGDDIKGWSDEKVLELIQQTSQFADVLLDIAMKDIQEQRARGIKKPQLRYSKLYKKKDAKH